MLKDLISNQKKVFSRRLYAVGHIGSIFSDLKSKGDLLTAILMLQEKDRSLLLFIFQDDPYACFELLENRFSPLSFSDYFKEMSQARGAIDLYLTDPIFFKVLLVLAQKKPNIVATTDIINIEGVLAQIQKKEKEAVLVLKKEPELNLFFFIKGKPCRGYLPDSPRMTEERELQEKLMLYADGAFEGEPMEIQIYYDLEVIPAGDVEEAVKDLGEGVEQRLASCPRIIFSDNGKEIEKILDKGLFTLGRDARSDLIIKDPMASREHALIKQEQDGFYIEDRTSRNGTFLNKEKVTCQKLGHQDEIQIGSSIFRFIEKQTETGKIAAVSSPPDEEVPSVPPFAGWALEVLNGEEAGAEFELSARKFSLGRGNLQTDGHIAVKDPKVSRHHADLEWTEDGFLLTDLKSTNGIFVNDQKVESRLLAEDDIITIGDTRLRVVYRK